MTGKTWHVKTNGDRDKMPGWFSWRHADNLAHLAANEGRSRRESKDRKRREADERNSVNPGAQHPNTRGHRLGRCSCPEATR